MSTDRGMDKEDVVPMYNGILVIIKSEIRPPAATWMHLETVILSMPEKNKYHVTSLTCLPKYDTNELIYKTETDSQTENKHCYQRRKPGGGGKLEEFGINAYTLLDIKQMTKMICYIAQGTLHPKHQKSTVL